MKAVFILALAIVSTSAMARPNTLDLSCNDAAGLVAETGSIVLNVGDLIYDRFVASPAQCGGGAAKAFVKTVDAKACNVGYVCVQQSQGDHVSSKYYAPGPRTCKAGTVFTEYSRDNGNKTWKCGANGKYAQVGGPAPTAPVYRGCQEGARYTNYDRDNGNTSFVCQNGKYRRN